MDNALDRDDLFIGGVWRKASGDNRTDVVSPSTEEVVGRVPLAGTDDVDLAVAAARQSFDEGSWRRRPPAERGAVLGRLADILEKNAADIARLVTTEMGAPVAFCADDHVLQPLGTLRYYAELAAGFPFEEVRDAGRRRSLVIHEPVGVVAAVVPWNAPLRSVITKLAPSLLAGCSVVVKPAPETPLDGYPLAEALVEAGVPAGVVSILAADRDAGAHLVGHPGVDKVSFTGSTAAGRAVMALCAPHLTQVTLELGGKSAALVLADVDIDDVLRRLVPTALGNTGQSCVAQTRLLFPAARHDEFVDRLCAAVARWPVGDPFETSTLVGPLVSERQRDRVLGYLDVARREGARAAIGGGRPTGLPRGWYVEPTVLTGVENSMRIAREEVFGPVITVIPYANVEEAVAIANDSEYGLAGSVWSADPDAGVEIARRLRSGTLRVNGAPQPASAPFGGFKQSGFGREYGPEGLLSYLEPKAIAVRPSPRAAAGAAR